MRTTKPRKKRKEMRQAPTHKRYKTFSAPLSPELKKNHNINSLPLRTGDTIRIMRGERKGSEGKISQVDRTSYRILVEGATREKVDGTTILIPIHPSKVMITRLNLSDKWRRKILERKGAAKIAEPPEEKIVEEKGSETPKKARLRKTKKSGGT